MKHLKLFELHYTDVFSENFVIFRKKYNKFKNDKNLYVQFTNYKGDVLDRTSVSNPSHSDPVGNYAYPLKYVIENPSDLWYGMNAKNLRVLEKTNYTYTLTLNFINDENDCFNNALKLKKEWRTSYVRDLISLVKQNYKSRIEPKNSGYWGRVFFQILQVDFDNKDENGKYIIRSGIEQTKLLLNGGWNAIEDISTKDSTAIINSNEPEQICFLDRKSFIVKEVIFLSDNKDAGVSTTSNPDEMSSNNRKWASLILEIMEDKILDKSTESGFDTVFYSQKGREVRFNFKKPDSYYDKKFAQKLHKVNQLFNESSIILKIITEKGTIEYTSQSDEKINDILNIIKNEWYSIKNNENIHNWIPRSNEQRKKEDKQKSDEYYRAEREKVNQKDLGRLDSWLEKLQEWCRFLKTDLQLPQEREDILKLYQKVFVPLSNICHMQLNQDGIDYLEKNIRIIKNNSQDFSNDDNFSMVLFGIGESFDKSLLISFLETLLKIINHIALKEKDSFTFHFYNNNFEVSESYVMKWKQYNNFK